VTNERLVTIWVLALCTVTEVVLAVGVFKYGAVLVAPMSYLAVKLIRLL
jgi:hypothetical protein